MRQFFSYRPGQISGIVSMEVTKHRRRRKLASFKELYRYEAGEEIAYTVSQSNAKGYETVVDNMVITNTHVAGIAEQEPSVTQEPDAPATTEPDPTTEPGLGDVNADGKVDLADAQLLLKAALKLVTLMSQQKAVADVDGNGMIQLADARKLLKVALKLEKF